RALQRLASRFANSEALDTPRSLGVSVQRDGPPAGILPGDAAGARLKQQDAVAILPYQVNARKVVIGAYVITQASPAALPPQPYTIAFTGIDGRHAAVTLYSPDSGTLEPLTVLSRTAQSVKLALAITDVPRLIEIEERPS